MPPADWRSILAELAATLEEVDARRIVEEASGLEGAALYAALGEPATERQHGRAVAMAERRAAGEPLQYVLGHWSFRTLDLMVDRRVLIPRPETEVVVEVALAEVRRLGRAAPVCVDLGTGSGAIALSLAAELPGADVWATDASADAVAVARANLAGIGRPGRRVRIDEGSWFTPLPAALRGHVDLVVSNPPYIADGEDLPDEVVRWEPAGALFAGPAGTEAVAAILAEAPRWLAPDGVVVLEIAPHQAAAAATLAAGAGFTGVRVEPDLAGRDRALVARR